MKFWLLTFIGVALSIWLVGACSAGGSSSSSTTTFRSGNTTSPASSGSSGTGARNSRTEVETTYSDTLVWRFCSSALSGNMTQNQLASIYGMDKSGLSKDKQYSTRIIDLAREAVDAYPKSNMNLIPKIADTCRDWRAHDAKRAGF